MENVSFDILNKKIIDLANAVEEIKIQINLLKNNSLNIYDSELREELNEWDKLSTQTLENFESKI
ncbi:MAG: hypothetical protein QT05_C0036G0003 [archaeon GW2011_AR13]|nr:MAG: hypothetical protein QT05_C0036G0003 [archaeon GW2011_AR13]HIG94185.1 hypothetical protein [Nanoarchaeota archaeon]HIH62705.1 hypothetical protein [Nanoarchaeota archaeon]HIJ09911.1 hypothetical protein [Nanoarchaeota archaeon]